MKLVSKAGRLRRVAPVLLAGSALVPMAGAQERIDSPFEVHTRKTLDGRPCLSIKNAGGLKLLPDQSVSLSTSHNTIATLPACPVVKKSEKDFSIGGGIFFTPDRQGLQGTTHNATALASYHQQFHPWLGYKANFGFSQIQLQDRTVDSFSATSSTFELSGMFVAQQGEYHGRLQMFAEVGSGALFFNPKDTFYASHHSVKPTMNFGVGSNIPLTNHLILRLEYRGLFYKYPDIGSSPPGSTNGQKYLTVTHQPTFSFAYRWDGSR